MIDKQLIKAKLDVLSALSLFERFDVLMSISNFILLNLNSIDKSEVLAVLAKMEELRFAMAYEKATETVSGRLDRTLAYECLRLGRSVLSGKDLEKLIKDVLYFDSESPLSEHLRREIDG